MLILSCKSESSTTPLKYLNTSKVKKAIYSIDSLEISKILKKMIAERQQPFDSEKIFDSKTKVYVDSIIYSPDKLLMIAFVITQNTTNKLMKKENNEPYFYNANYLLCSKSNENTPIKVYDFADFYLVVYYNYKDIKERLKEHCFSDLQKENKYNLNDIRFWKSNDCQWILNNAKGIELP